ncbi:hypothetical protein [Acetobacter sp. P5B1]
MKAMSVEWLRIAVRLCQPCCIATALALHGVIERIFGHLVVAGSGLSIC